MDICRALSVGQMARLRLENERWCGMLQVPWFQVGTPFLVSTEVSASVADDIVEYQQDRRSRASHSLPGQEDAPEASRPKTFLRRYPALCSPPACALRQGWPLCKGLQISEG